VNVAITNTAADYTTHLPHSVLPGSICMHLGEMEHTANSS